MVDNYKIDGYSWFNNGGDKLLHNDQIIKTFYNVKTYDSTLGKLITSKDFKKEIYMLPNKKPPYLIHYTSSLENVVIGPHGNVKNKEGAENYVPTKPSTIKAIKEKLTQTGQPVAIYTNYEAENKPRNKKQIRNLNYVSKNCF